MVEVGAMTVATDARVDLVSGLVGLTRWGAEAYGEFDHSVKREVHAALRSCPATARAVDLLEGAPHFRFDAPYCWALHHAPLPDLLPLGEPPGYCRRAWNHAHATLDAVTEAMRAVAAHGATAAALATAAEMQAAPVAQAAEWIWAADPEGWLDRALGPSPTRPAVVLAAMIDWHGHGATVGPTAYAILGGKGVGPAGLPVYGSAVDVPAVVLHEIAHARLNPAVESVWPALPAGVRQALGRAYPSPRGDLAEAAVQGLTFAYCLDVWGPAALHDDQSKRPPMVDLLRGAWLDMLPSRPIAPQVAVAVLANAVAGGQEGRRT